MARAVWSGVISFGLVSVPVGMFTATEEHEPSFHQFAAGGTDRIRYKRVNERTGREVDYANIIKGVDVGGGRYVMVSEEELDQIAPGRSRALEVSGFVDLDDIDPIYFNKAYYLAPTSEENKKTYALLRDAMAETNRAGIATFVMHGKQHLAAIHASGDLLVLETLFFADEVRDAKKTLGNLPGKTSFRNGELAMATKLIESMGQAWKPDRYRDTYTDRVNDLIQAKRKGNEVQVADEAPAATNVTDLLEALRRSVDSARLGKSGSAGKARGKAQDSKARAKKIPAKSSGTAKRVAAKDGPATQTARSQAKKTAAKKTAHGTSRRGTRRAS
jgi:DNA end-binding protein Ku